MESHLDYLMESDEEIVRLEIKTKIEDVHRQARWGGIKPGMRVADIGCGPGKTSDALLDLVQPGGEVLGIDIAPHRVSFAKEKYGKPGLFFEHRNAIKPLDDLGEFDFVWVRFLLEYHRDKAFDIVQNLTNIVKAGGILCLIDLDYNCLSHFGFPDRLDTAIAKINRLIEQKANFDSRVGIKLYSFLYDLKWDSIDVMMMPHHLIFGELDEADAFNWTKKVEVAVKNSGFQFEDYPGGYEEFSAEFKKYFFDPRRFTYTPLIACRAQKP
ncbi:MAG: class I SAM-dependent methyltransferase [Desulfobacteraceae bacterium]